MPFAANNDVEIQYSLSGAGDDTVVLVPGLGLRGAAWEPVARLLREHFRLLVLEPRGSGVSDAPDEPYTAEAVAEDVCAVLDDAALAQAHFVGVSMGGLIVQDFAARHPDRVSSLTLLSTYAAPDEWFARMMGLRREMVLRDGVVEQLKLSILSIASPFAFREIPDTIRGFEQAFKDSPPEQHAYLRQMDYCLDGGDRSERSARIGAPTLVVTGSHDFLTPVTLGRELADLIPGAQYVEVEGASHSLFLERPGAVADLVTRHAISTHPSVRPPRRTEEPQPSKEEGRL